MIFAGAKSVTAEWAGKVAPGTELLPSRRPFSLLLGDVLPDPNHYL